MNIKKLELAVVRDYYSKRPIYRPCTKEDKFAGFLRGALAVYLFDKSIINYANMGEPFKIEKIIDMTGYSVALLENTISIVDGKKLYRLTSEEKTAYIDMTYLELFDKDEKLIFKIKDSKSLVYVCNENEVLEAIICPVVVRG